MCRDVMSVSLRVATLESIDILTSFKSLECHIDAMDLTLRFTSLVFYKSGLMVLVQCLERVVSNPFHTFQLSDIFLILLLVS
jgi:hypothetical protein